jgi:hypothetical protein
MTEIPGLTETGAGAWRDVAVTRGSRLEPGDGMAKSQESLPTE